MNLILLTKLRHLRLSGTAEALPAYLAPRGISGNLCPRRVPEGGETTDSAPNARGGVRGSRSTITVLAARSQPARSILTSPRPSSMPELYSVPLTGGLLTEANATFVAIGGNKVDVFPSLHCAASAFVLGHGAATSWQLRSVPGRRQRQVLAEHEEKPAGREDWWRSACHATTGTLRPARRSPSVSSRCASYTAAEVAFGA